MTIRNRIVALVVVGMLATLAGSAEAATLRKFLISPTSLDFGDVPVGTTSPGQSITITNVSPQPVVLSLGVGSAGDFGETSSCGSTLAPGGSCLLTYQFTPAALGPDTQTILEAISGQQFTIALKGNGIRALLVTPTGLDFGDVAVGHISASQLVIVTNVSTSSVATNLTFGSNPLHFLEGGDCLSVMVLTPGQFCHVAYQFASVTAGAQGGVASFTIGGQTFNVSLSANGYVNTPGDFDADGQTDLGVYRPSTGEWFFKESSSNFTAYETHTLGLSTDRPVPGDYDGDGKLDLALFRPSTGQWIVASSTSRFNNISNYSWGTSTDIPVPGDYDGDGKTDLAVFRPSEGTWYILDSSTGLPDIVQWGTSTDIPVPADYDGDGKIDIAFFRPSTGTWFIVPSSTGVPYSVQWGTSGDLTVPADYDGDGTADIAVFRPSDGTWYILSSKTGTPMFEQWGISTDVPVPGDYDGDGKTDLAVFRPSTATWYVVRSSDGTVFTQQWGLSTDIPLPETYFGRWVHPLFSAPGVREPVPRPR